MIKAGFIGFRPLTGIKVSERMVLLPILDNNDMVSVPSRGLRYLNQKQYRKLVTKWVSVPSRGLRYLNHNQTLSKNKKKHCFRPLTGIKVSELLCVCVCGFRPLTGIKVSERLDVLSLGLVPTDSFRPLTGIKVSELAGTKHQKETIGFPSPHGD